MPSIVLQPDIRIGSRDDDDDDDGVDGDEVEVVLLMVVVLNWSRLKYKDDGSLKIKYPFRYLVFKKCSHVSLSTAEEHAML